MKINVSIFVADTFRGSKDVSTPCLIGRSKKADLRVAHPEICREHCELYEEDGILFLRDNDSLNGTIYKGKFIDMPTELKLGEEFSCDKLIFKISEPWNDDLKLTPLLDDDHVLDLLDYEGDENLTLLSDPPTDFLSLSLDISEFDTTLTHHEDVDFSLDDYFSQSIITCAVRIWDAESGDELQKLEGHTGRVLSASFSPDGTRIVTAGGDRTARIWNTESGDELQKLEGHTDEVNSASFSPDGKKIVTASGDKIARIWDAESGEELLKLEENTGWLVSASTSFHAFFSPDGKKIVTTSQSGFLRIWDAESGDKLLKLEGHVDRINSASFSPDGKKIVTKNQYDFGASLQIWDAESGDELLELGEHIGSVYPTFLSPNGERIFMASGDNTARILDVNSGDELLKLEGHIGNVYSASFSPDGKRIVTGSNDGTTYIWDADSGKELRKLEGHTKGHL